MQTACPVSLGRVIFDTILSQSEQTITVTVLPHPSLFIMFLLSHQVLLRSSYAPIAIELITLTTRSLATQFDGLLQTASASPGPSSSAAAPTDNIVLREELQFLESISALLGAQKSLVDARIQAIQGQLASVSSASASSVSTSTKGDMCLFYCPLLFHYLQQLLSVLL